MSNNKFYNKSTGLMGDSSNLYVSPSGYKTTKKLVKSCCQECDELLTNFLTLLSDTQNSAILSGKVSEALNEFIVYVKSAKGIALEISSQYSKLVNSFLDRIDTDDDFLYDSDCEKDFTDYALEKFQEVTIHRNETGNWWQDHLNDAPRWFIQDVLNIHFLDDYDANMYITEDSMKELAKTESKRLDDIFEFVRDDDKLFEIRFEKLIEIEEKYRLLLFGMIDIVANKNTFTLENIKLKLTELFNDLIDSLSYVASFTNYDENTIRTFVESKWAALYFSKFTNVISGFIADLGSIEVIQMTIYNAFGITKDSIEYGNYEKAIIKNQLLETLDDMSQNYQYDESDEKAAINTFKKYIDLIKKYGDKWYDHLDGRTKEAKKLKEFLDSCGGASVILKYGDEALDYFYRLFVDYDKSVQIIESFMKNCDFEGTTKECLDEIKELYNKELGAWVKEATQKIASKGLDIAMSELENVVPVLNVIGKIRDGIDLVGEVTGSGTRAESMLNAVVYSEIYYDSEHAYENALETMKSLSPNSKGYSQSVKDLQNCFDFCKKSLINLLQEMANATQGSKKSYYQYCMTIAQNASMADKSQLQVISYEKYMENY